MILVENVIGRRLHVNSIDAFNTKNRLFLSTENNRLYGVTCVHSYHGILHGVRRLGLSTISSSLISGSLFHRSSPKSKLNNSMILVSLEVLYKSFYTLLFFVSINYIILIKGIIAGIERAVKYLMPLLFLFLIGMVIRNITLPGAMEAELFIT